MFLLNSCPPRFCAALFLEPLFFLCYEVILPSSLSMVISSTLVYSTCGPVSVYSTVFCDFVFLACISFHFSLSLPCSVLQFPISLTHRVPVFTFLLGAGLTLRGLSLRRKPSAFGDSVSHRISRYLCQHSLF